MPIHQRERRQRAGEADARRRVNLHNRLATQAATSERSQGKASNASRGGELGGGGFLDFEPGRPRLNSRRLDPDAAMTSGDQGIRGARNVLSIRFSQRLVRYHSHHRRMRARSRQDRSEPLSGLQGVFL